MISTQGMSMEIGMKIYKVVVVSKDIVLSHLKCVFQFNCD